MLFDEFCKAVYAGSHNPAVHSSIAEPSLLCQRIESMFFRTLSPACVLGAFFFGHMLAVAPTQAYASCGDYVVIGTPMRDSEHAINEDMDVLNSLTFLLRSGASLTSTHDRRNYVSEHRQAPPTSIPCQGPLCSRGSQNSDRPVPVLLEPLPLETMAKLSCSHEANEIRRGRISVVWLATTRVGFPQRVQRPPRR